MLKYGFRTSYKIRTLAIHWYNRADQILTYDPRCVFGSYLSNCYCISDATLLCNFWQKTSQFLGGKGGSIVSLASTLTQAFGYMMSIYLIVKPPGWVTFSLGGGPTTLR